MMESTVGIEIEDRIATGRRILDDQRAAETTAKQAEENRLNEEAEDAWFEVGMGVIAGLGKSLVRFITIDRDGRMPNDYRVSVRLNINGLAEINVNFAKISPDGEKPKWMPASHGGHKPVQIAILGHGNWDPKVCQHVPALVFDKHGAEYQMNDINLALAVAEEQYKRYWEAFTDYQNRAAKMEERAEQEGLLWDAKNAFWCKPKPEVNIVEPAGNDQLAPDPAPTPTPEELIGKGIIEICRHIVREEMDRYNL